jgi:peptidoglycan hydrolase CwlO-like protein
MRIVEFDDLRNMNATIEAKASGLNDKYWESLSKRDEFKSELNKSQQKCKTLEDKLHKLEAKHAALQKGFLF